MLQKIRFFDKKDPKVSLSELLSGWQYSNLFIWHSMWTRLEHAHCLETINNMWFLGKRETVNAIGRKRTLTDSERKMNRSEVSAIWKKCRIYVGDQLNRCCWMERTQGSATRQISRWSDKDFAWLLLIGKPSMLPFSQSFFIFYEFMMMPMIIFGRY